jgi:hypothetical protein
MVIPMKAADNRKDWSPSRLRSRQVVWKMGSPPRRTISPETASEPSRMTALWLSVTLRPSTLSLSMSM